MSRRRRGKEASQTHPSPPGLNCQAGTGPPQYWKAALRCVRGSDASLLEHVQNLSRISLHYDPTQDRGRIGCMLSSSLQWHTYSHSLCMLVPGELELTFCRAPYFPNEKERHRASCINTAAVVHVITLSLAKLNHISFY